MKTFKNLILLVVAVSFLSSCLVQEGRSGRGNGRGHGKGHWKNHGKGHGKGHGQHRGGGHW